MFDCPEASQSSPLQISVNFSVFDPSMVSAKGPISGAASSGWTRGQLDRPAPSGVGFGRRARGGDARRGARRQAAYAERRADRFARDRRAGQPHRASLLDHHVVSHHGGDSNLALRRGRCEQDESRDRNSRKGHVDLSVQGASGGDMHGGEAYIRVAVLCAVASRLAGTRATARLGHPASKIPRTRGLRECRRMISLRGGGVHGR
jgi:hypothetical protein